MTRWAIVGGGYRGIMAACFLNKSSLKTFIIDKAPHLGGVLHSPTWGAYYTDNGCHLFDNIDKEATTLALNILGENYIGVNVKYFSITGSHQANDVAIPDFSTFSDEKKQKILKQMLDAPVRTAKARSLGEALKNKFGNILSTELKAVAHKMYAINPEEIEASVLEASLFRRVRLFSDQESIVLRQDQRLNECLAISSQEDPFQFYKNRDFSLSYRNFYPGTQGMQGFCLAAKEYLKSSATEFLLSHHIDSISPDGVISFKEKEALAFDKILWTLDLGFLSSILFKQNPLSDLLHKTPMVLIYLELDASQIPDFTYGHDFCELHNIFRISTMGTYSNQVTANGKTFICLEMPTKLNSALWNNTESYFPSILKELKKLDFNLDEWPENFLIRKTPVSYTVPKLGYSEAHSELKERIYQYTDKIIVSEPSAFSKVDITSSMKKILDKHIIEV